MSMPGAPPVTSNRIKLAGEGNMYHMSEYRALAAGRSAEVMPCRVEGQSRARSSLLTDVQAS